MAGNGNEGVVSCWSVEPSGMHRADELRVGNGEARSGADYRVYAAIGAKGGPALVLNPFLYIADCKSLFAKEATTHVASFQLCPMIG